MSPSYGACSQRSSPAGRLYLPRTGPRRIFRTRTGADAAEWARARGRALSVALMGASYYRASNPVRTATARHVIGEVLEETVRGDRAG
ncbi:hypothetical protein ACFVS9_18950 [Streptomyces sp. NPDC058008]|uniref:hypothetical protein n=1 Tax=Streptomyces sp. NPDC058008 TaxID=3346303 RepID=UPI0036E30524